jgi:hypothetical protein
MFASKAGAKYKYVNVSDNVAHRQVLSAVVYGREVLIQR